MSEQLARTQMAVTACLEELHTLFDPGVRLTFVMRTPGEPEAEMIVGDDDDFVEFGRTIDRRMPRRSAVGKALAEGFHVPLPEREEPPREFYAEGVFGAAIVDVAAVPERGSVAREMIARECEKLASPVQVTERWLEEHGFEQTRNRMAYRRKIAETGDQSAAFIVASPHYLSVAGIEVAKNPTTAQVLKLIEALQGV